MTSSSYQTMLIFVFFDLPIKTKEQKKAYAKFRRTLAYAGFLPYQKSVYIRDCASHQAADRHTGHLERLSPAQGHIGILRVTSKQFALMRNIYYAQPAPKQNHSQLCLTI